MVFLQFTIAIAALYLFLVFIAQPLLLVGRVLSRIGSSPMGPNRGSTLFDDLESSPREEDAEVEDWIERGREFGRKHLAKVRDGAGGFRYEYTGPDAPKAQKPRLRKIRRVRRSGGRNSPDTSPREGRLALDWKGFDEGSTPWEVLGVARDASIAQVKAAYRRLITRFHPDRFQHLSDGEIAELERDTKVIHAAYAKLAKS